MDFSIQEYEHFTWVWIVVAVGVFSSLLFITAPYGRHTKTTWGPMIDNKWGWILMEVVVLGVVAFFVLTGKLIQSSANWVCLGLFALHYINRSLIFPFRMKTKGKRMPVAIMLMGMAFNMINGGLIGYWFGSLKVYAIEWLYQPQSLVGALIFILGMRLNWRSDNRLFHLRTGSSTGYVIPQGGFFKWVSCPNLLGEMIEWLGFALLTWSLPGWAFFIWTVANLFPRALAHHRWYRSHFPDYPAGRKAVIPFLI